MLKRQVEEAAYLEERDSEGREMWIKYVTAIAALIGAIAGVFNLVRHK